MAYLLHSHPSVVYYACHNEPLRMFVPTAAEDDTPERDIGERHLDAALLATLRSIDESRHVHEASGIGDDVHSYSGSLTGRNLYRVVRAAGVVRERVRLLDRRPAGREVRRRRAGRPRTEQMREWVSRLSFIGSTVGFAGMPDRYASLRDWADATEAYGAALAKHQTEWFRIHRGAPFMGYRWHFWADWWGYAGGGLVDVERAPKRTYTAFADASRPVLVTARTDRSVYEPGEVTLPVFMVNDTARAWRGPVRWEICDARPPTVDHPRSRRLPHRPRVPRRRRGGRRPGRGRRRARVRDLRGRRATGGSTQVGDVSVTLTPGRRSDRHLPLGRRDELRAPALPRRRRCRTRPACTPAT